LARRDLTRPSRSRFDDLFLRNISTMNLLVTAVAETHEVTLVIGSAFADWFDVVDLFHRNVPAFLHTHLAEGMLVYVAGPDLTPLSSVSLVPVVATCEVIVVIIHELLVLSAVAVAVMLHEVWAARIPTGPLWFHWHVVSLLSAIEKPRNRSPRL
jgi:hypothetical protein